MSAHTGGGCWDGFLLLTNEESELQLYTQQSGGRHYSICWKLIYRRRDNTAQSFRGQGNLMAKESRPRIMQSMIKQIQQQRTWSIQFVVQYFYVPPPLENLVWVDGCLQPHQIIVLYMLNYNIHHIKEMPFSITFANSFVFDCYAPNNTQGYSI